jgi:hypothetical protein
LRATTTESPRPAEQNELGFVANNMVVTPSDEDDGVDNPDVKPALWWCAGGHRPADLAGLTRVPTVHVQFG